MCLRESVFKSKSTGPTTGPWQLKSYQMFHKLLFVFWFYSLCFQHHNTSLLLHDKQSIIWLLIWNISFLKITANAREQLVCHSPEGWRLVFAVCHTINHISLIIKDKSRWSTWWFLQMVLIKKLWVKQRRHFLLTIFNWVMPWQPFPTCSGVDFTTCWRNLFVVEGITVSDPLTNKISGSGSCLTGRF